MSQDSRDKTDSTPRIDTDKQARIDFWQAARTVGGALLAGVILVGMAASKIGRRPPGP
jgi:hypothetical protein